MGSIRGEGGAGGGGGGGLDATDFPSLAPATTARNRIQPSAADAIPLTLRGHASQSVRLLSIEDSGGTSRFSFDLGGYNLYIGSVTLSGVSAMTCPTNYVFQGEGSTAIHFINGILRASAAGAVASIVRAGHASPSVDLWEVQTSAGTVMVAVDSSFRLVSNVTTGTAPMVVASTTVVTNLNADKLDGKDATDFAPCTQATLTAAASVALDFAAAGLATLTTNQNTTFTTSNRAAGRQPYNLRIIGGGAHTLTFPAGWKWLNSTMPAAIASGKTGRLCLECYGSADTDVVASFAVEA